MNREILFRGKRKQDGLWVHGDLVRLKDGDGQIPCIYYFGEVYPETVGQFTGLKDKNGNKIFEGDIVKEKDCVHNLEVQIKGNKWIVYFKDGIFLGYWKNCGATFFLKSLDEIEVIGNIHDNPELLEVEE